MIKRILPFALLGCIVICNSACNNTGFKTKNGLQYKIVKDEPGPNANIGDIVSVNVRIKTGDSVILDSRKLNNNQPVEMQVQKATFVADWFNGLTMMSAGDSAVFRVPIDSIRKNIPPQQLASLPSFMKPGKMIEYDVKMVSVKTQAQYKKDMDTKATAQKQIDDQQLQQYFAKNNIKPQKTASGLYYVIEKQGPDQRLKKVRP